MVKKILNLVKNHIVESNDYHSAFKELYHDQSYYDHVKESILDKVDIIGVGVDADAAQ